MHLCCSHRNETVSDSYSNNGSSRKSRRFKNFGRRQRKMSEECEHFQNEAQIRSRSGTPIPGEGLELTQITHRIAALTFPTNGADAVYRASIKEISEKLKRNFPDRYKIFNVSQKRSDLGRANGVNTVVELGWPDDLAPPLDRLCTICKQLENWMADNRQNIAIIHCKGWRSRAAIIVAAYMNYTNICTGGENVDDKFSMQLFSEKFLGAYGQPSHKRYVKYFANLLMGVSRVNASAVFLTRITLSHLFIGMDIVLKIYERMKPIYTSEPIRIKDLTRLDLASAISLRGDVLLKCFQVRADSQHTSDEFEGSIGARRLLFQCQFNTCASEFHFSAMVDTNNNSGCAVKTGRIVFFKEELDRIFADESVDNQAAIELTFNMENPAKNSITTKQTTSKASSKALSVNATSLMNSSFSGVFARADSYENFEKSEDDRSISLPAESIKSPLYTGLTKNNNNNKLQSQILKRLKRNGTDPQQQQNRRSLSELQYVNNNCNNIKSNNKGDQRHSLSAKQQRQILLLSGDSSGVDSGVGLSDSPRANSTITTTKTTLSTPLNTLTSSGLVTSEIRVESPTKPLQGILKHRKTPNFDICQPITESDKMSKNPPKVPPKPKSRRSSYADSDDYGYEEEDPIRAEYDSSNQRDHSVLPVGLRPRPLSQQYRKRQRENEEQDSTSTHEEYEEQRKEDYEADQNGQEENEDEENSERVQRERARRLAKILRIGPDLVGKDRYDPNSKCFSYVPAKSLKEHYRTAPRKSLTSIRRLGGSRSESNLSPNAMEKAFEVMPEDLTQRANTPKWENEIDKLAPKLASRESSPVASNRRSVPPSEIARDYLSEPAPSPRLRQKREQVVHDLHSRGTTSSVTDTLDQLAGKPPPEHERPLRQRREQVVRELYNGSVTPSVTKDIDALAGVPPLEFERPLRQRREQVARDLYDRNMTRSITNELDALAGIPPPEFERPLRQRREQNARELLASTRENTSSALGDLDSIYGPINSDFDYQKRSLRQHREQEIRDLYNKSMTPSRTNEIDTIANKYVYVPYDDTTSHYRVQPMARGRVSPMELDFEREEKPIVFEQAKRAITRAHSPARSPPRFSSMGALNNMTNMDALLDANFYLSGGEASIPPQTIPRDTREKSMPAYRQRVPYNKEVSGWQSSEIPNKQFSKSVSQKELDDLNDLLESTNPSSRNIAHISRPTTKLPRHWEDVTNNNGINARDNFRDRNCRSVSAITYNRKPSCTESNDIPGFDSNSDRRDDWLEHKLRALQSKRANDPTALKQRNTERILLEELKNVNANRNTALNESACTTNGIDFNIIADGSKENADPLRDFEREERRLHATKSPFVDELRIANRLAQRERMRQQRNTTPNATTTEFSQDSNLRWQESPLLRASSVTPTSSSAWVTVEKPPAVHSKRGATPTGQIVRGKPPTPPPTTARERSRSPQTRSPIVARRASPTLNATKTTGARDDSAHVSRGIAALRSNIYEAERNRIDQRSANGVGSKDVNVPPYSTSNADDGGAEADNDEDDAETSGNDEFGHPQPIMQSSSSSSNRNSSSNRSETPRSIVNGGDGGRASATKSILKRANPSPELSSSGAAFVHATPSSYVRSDSTQELKSSTQASEESNPSAHVSSRACNRNPNWYSRQIPASSLNSTSDRAETPAFPTSSYGSQFGRMTTTAASGTATPLPYHPLLYRSETPATTVGSDGHVQHSNNNYHSTNAIYRSGSPRSYYDQSRRSSMTSIDGGEVIHSHPVFVKDTSKYWYKPNISREEAISMLKQKPPGTFIVRDSNSFPGAFGLALKVARPPPNAIAQNGDESAELVRHFLIEPSPKGVKLKGCANEPVFGTLAALVYQHSITPLALPCKLLLPEYDPALSAANEFQQRLDSNQALLERGAACNVTYLCSMDTESLTGPEALRRSATWGLEDLTRGGLRAIPVHFKVSAQGITLTDNTRSQFFRRHYPANLITYAGIDPENRVFDNNNCCQLPPCYVLQAPIFGFVARKLVVGGSVENACHVFAELDPDQPASAVIRFITNVMMPQAKSQQHANHHNYNQR